MPCPSNFRSNLRAAPVNARSAAAICSNDRPKAIYGGHRAAAVGDILRFYGDSECDSSEPVAAQHIERGTEAGTLETRDAVVRFGVQSIRDERRRTFPAQGVRDAACRFVVGAIEHGVRGIGPELRERIDDRLKIGEIIEVFLLDICDHGERRRKNGQRSIAFIGFRHEMGSRTRLCIAAQIRTCTPMQNVGSAPLERSACAILASLVSVIEAETKSLCPTEELRDSIEVVQDPDTADEVRVQGIKTSHSLPC